MLTQATRSIPRRDQFPFLGLWLDFILLMAINSPALLPMGEQGSGAGATAHAIGSESFAKERRQKSEVGAPWEGF